MSKGALACLSEKDRRAALHYGRNIQILSNNCATFFPSKSTTIRFKYYITIVPTCQYTSFVIISYQKTTVITLLSITEIIFPLFEIKIQIHNLWTKFQDFDHSGWWPISAGICYSYLSSLVLRTVIQQCTVVLIIDVWVLFLVCFFGLEQVQFGGHQPQCTMQCLQLK